MVLPTYDAQAIYVVPAIKSANFDRTIEVIGVGTGAIVPCSFALAARQSESGPAVGLASASLFSALTRLPAPLAMGAIAQGFSLPVAFAAFAVALAGAAVGMAAFAPSSRAGRAATKA